ncbi:type II toxin-antitoxin system VapC family toxin [Consotaella aegiceratis]|uniref:type II toxin-antitoxin system VapC family toxin n=1 Tax=Consotaella aegiceratis TaxID=3097961 RepID=UPI002F3F529D
MYLADTDILSAISPTAKVSVTDLANWMDAASPQLFLSVVTVAEVRNGIEKNERQGAIRKAAALREWWATVEHLYAKRILPFDLGAAHIAGVLSDRARGAGFDPGFADVVIAATAEAHGLTVLTRNTRDFEPLGVSFLNPYEGLPPLQSG